MNRSTLPRHARAHAPGWAHPYPSGPLSPFFYADGDPDPEGDPEGEAPKDPAPEADDPDPEGDLNPEGDDPDPEGADELGDKGKRALASMKDKWRAERDKARDLERRLAEKDGADDAEQARRKAEADALARANARILKAEIRAAAKGKLADPKDALTFLDLEQFEVDEDGEIDAEEIEEAISGLLKAKPYLAAQGRPRFQGTADGGAQRKAGRPKQLTEQDLKTMTPEEIDKAAEDGRLDNLLKGG